MKIKMNKSLGFSIVEFLIASTLGLFVLGGATQVYLSNKAAYNAQMSMSQLQESGRFLQNYLTREIRMAGYQGCNHINATTPNALATTMPANGMLTEDTVIYGYSGSGGTWSPTIPTWLSSNFGTGSALKPDTDVIVVTKVQAQTEQLTANMASTTDAISVQGINNFAASDLILITDCDETDIFRASTGTSATTLNHTIGDNVSAQLTKAYQTDAHVGRIESYSFYIKDTGRINASGDPIYALYRQNLSGTEEELISGVSEMKIRYGVDSSGDGAADTYQTASTVAAANNWSRVVSVQILNLIHSIEQANYEITDYEFDGTTYTPSDRLLRKEWTTFIRLRNYK